MSRCFYRSALAFMTFLAFLVAPLAVAASQQFVSDTTSQVVSWDDSWTEREPGETARSFDDGATIRHEESGTDLAIIFVPGDADIEQVRDEVLENTDRPDGAVSMIEYGSYNNVEYQVDLLRSEDVPESEGVFSLKMTNADSNQAVVYVLITQVESFSSGVSAVQAGVTMDGAVAMDGVDPAGMQSFLQLAESASSQTGSSSQVDLPTVEPSTETAVVTQAPVSTGGTTSYTNTHWGYTVVYDNAFMDVTSGTGVDLMLGSPSPVMVVGFMGLENPGVSSSVLFEALTPTFIDTLGPGGSYFDGGYQSDRAYWAGINSDGNQLVQQMVIVSPGTIVIVTLMGEPGVPMNTVGEVTLNGISVFGN